MIKNVCSKLAKKNNFIKNDILQFYFFRGTIDFGIYLKFSSTHNNDLIFVISILNFRHI